MFLRYGRPVPSRNPRLRPALERAMPADAASSTGVELACEPLLVLFGDGKWHLAAVRARRKDRIDRDVIDVEWHAAGDTWGESYVCDPERMREVPTGRVP